MVKGLYLCGTVHLDLAGPERLRKVLQTLTPEYVAIESYPELSQEVLAKRKELAGIDGKTLLQRIREKSKTPIEGIRADSALVLSNILGYEVWVPFEYAEKTGAGIIHIEDKECAERITKGFLDGILADQEKAGPIIEMLKFSPKTLKSIFDFCYEFDTNEGDDTTELIERNRVFAERIRKLDGKVLAVTGKNHVYGTEPTLQTLLGDYNPKAFKLIQADYFDSKVHQ